MLRFLNAYLATRHVVLGLVAAAWGCTGTPTAPVPPPAPAATPATPSINWPLPESEHDIFGLPIHRLADELQVHPPRILLRKGYIVGHYINGRTPAWVSYHLTRDYVDGKEFIPREKLKWRSDLDLPENERAEDTDYKKSGYSRGHMAMQSDLRGRSEACEREGYLLSNVCPQRQAFNDGIWKTLEMQCKDWARTYGEVWVLCGPLFKDPVPRLQGETQGRVAIPAEFWKIVVRRDGNRPAVLAFLFPHEPVPERDTPLERYLTSVDEVERLGEIDVFHGLPDAVEQRIEAERPTTLWPRANRN